MPGSRHVSFDRTRRLFLLLGELHELKRHDSALLAHLTTGLMDLIPAQVMIIGTIEEAPGTGPVLHGVTEHGWSSADERRRVFEFFQRNGLVADPLARALTSAPLAKASVFTARRRDLVSRRDWHESAFFRETRHLNGADDAIYSQRALPDGRREAIGFTRAAGDRPFTEEDRDLAYLAHVGLAPFLDRAAHAPSPVPALSPRERETLEALLRGGSDKEIAAALGIGRNTVNKYVMAVFRAYGVTSRAQLMARVLGG